ncbi:beta-4C adrenergic receptor-like [Acanthaster planci]|uniref:Beta-4C adrenergic receptor-like n=1 Tax=Acanthaster planci TaxID=133434 RepID=A0A8B7ZUB0_ACAPL|nr:beta-4C adrenergic receptor-like [Acanthaster planci]
MAEWMIQNMSDFTTGAPSPVMEEAKSDSQGSAYGPLVTVLRTFFIALNSLMAITGNAFSLAVMKSVDTPRFPPSSKLFLCNVILSDLAYGAVSVWYVAPSALNYWPYGQFACQLACVCLILANFCCVNAAILITVDRLLAVVYPLHHGIMIPTKRAIMAVVLATFLSVSETVATLANGERISYTNRVVLCTISWDRASPTNLPRLIVYSSCGLFLPAVVLTVCYTKLYLVARRHAQLLAKLRRNPELAIANHRAVKMCALITATFLIAWTPYVIVSFRNYVTREETSPMVEFVTSWVCLCNSWWDVIIYFFMAREFRKTAHKLVCRPWLLRKSQPHHRQTTPSNRQLRYIAGNC